MCRCSIYHKKCLCFSVAGTSILWWLYINHRLNVNETLSKETTETKDVKKEAEMSRDYAQALLVYAIAATVFTVSTVSVCVC